MLYSSAWVSVFDFDDAVVAGWRIPEYLVEAQKKDARYPVYYVDTADIAKPWHNVWFWKYVGASVVPCRV